MTDRSYRLTMADLPEDERPRERLFSIGPGSLSDIELVAILVGAGHASTGESALDLSKRLLAGEGDGERPAGIRGLAQKDAGDLLNVKGIGPVKASQLMAAVELGKRLAETRAQRTKIGSARDVAGLMMERMRFLEQEHFRVVILNTKHQVLGIETVSKGGLDSTSAEPREIFKVPLRRNAAAVILVHNHPSGDPTPSPGDLAVTERMVEAGELLGIEVIDHIIIGEHRFASLREGGTAFTTDG